MIHAMSPVRWRARLAAALPAAAIAVAVVAANLFALDHPLRLDLTSAGVYSIGPQTRQVLAGLRERVSVTFFYDQRSKEMGDARALLRQYAAASPWIALANHDPALAPAEARRHQVRFAGTAVFETGGRRVVVHGGSEADFTNGLIRVTARGQQTLCFTEGHVEADLQSLSTHDHFEGDMGSGHSHSSGGRALVLHERHGMGIARDALTTLGYQVRSVRLVGDAAALGGCSVVVIAGPQQPFTAGEVALLRAWALAGGRLVALVDPFVASGLDPLFAEFGVRLERRRVVDAERHYWTDAATPAVSRYAQHPITRNLALTFFPGAAPLAPRPLPGADVRVLPLVQSSDTARSEPIERAADPSEPGLQTLAVLATRKLAAPPVPGAPAAAAPERRAELFLVGDGDFASNSFFPILGNGALFLNAVSHLAEQQQLIDITPRQYELPRLQMTNTQMRATFVASTLVLPGAALALAGLAWWRRRR